MTVILPEENIDKDRFEFKEVAKTADQPGSNDKLNLDSEEELDVPDPDLDENIGSELVEHKLWSKKKERFVAEGDKMHVTITSMQVT